MAEKAGVGRSGAEWARPPKHRGRFHPRIGCRDRVSAPKRRSERRGYGEAVKQLRRSVPVSGLAAEFGRAAVPFRRKFLVGS